jgi:hypothetical protein
MSQLKPSPLNYETTAMFVENIFDTVKKAKAAKEKNITLDESKILSSPFDYAFNEMSPVKKRKTKKTSKKNSKVKKIIPPKKKPSLHKTKPLKETPSKRRKAPVTKTPRKYTKRATKASVAADIDDEEAAFILSSISQRSFDSFYNRLNNKIETTETSSTKYDQNQTNQNNIVMLDHNYFHQQTNEVQLPSSEATNITEVVKSQESSQPNESKIKELNAQEIISTIIPYDREESSVNIAKNTTNEVNNNKYPASPESAKKRWLRMVTMTSTETVDEKSLEVSPLKKRKISREVTKSEFEPNLKIVYNETIEKFNDKKEQLVEMTDAKSKVEKHIQLEKVKLENDTLNENILNDFQPSAIFPIENKKEEHLKLEEKNNDEDVERDDWEKILKFHQNSIEKLVEANKKYGRKTEYCEPNSSISNRIPRFQSRFSRFSSSEPDQFLTWKDSLLVSNYTPFQRSISEISSDPRNVNSKAQGNINSFNSQFNFKNNEELTLNQSYNSYEARPSWIKQKSDSAEFLCEEQEIKNMKLRNFVSEKPLSTFTSACTISDDLTNLNSLIKPKIAICSKDPRLNHSLNKEENDTPKKKVRVFSEFVTNFFSPTIS